MTLELFLGIHIGLSKSEKENIDQQVKKKIDSMYYFY